MLDTLIKIGQWRSKQTSEWDRFLDPPKVKYEDKKKNPIKNYILPIIFDLDEMTVNISSEYLKEYDQERDLNRLKAIKILPGRYKATYCTTPPNKLEQIYKTFFGKGDSKSGDLIQVLEKDFAQSQTTILYQILQKCFLLKSKFLEVAYNIEKEKIDPQKIIQSLNLSKNETIALFFICIKYGKYGFDKVIPFAEIEEYVQFLSDKFINQKSNNTLKTSINAKNLCYASGKRCQDVGVIELNEKYSPNKMFVTTTLNYAAMFLKNNFSQNYQVNKINQINLDSGAKFLMKNYRITIAEVDHVIIPQFFSSENMEYELFLDGIKKKTDILFSFKTLDNIRIDLEDNTENPYWLNFLAFESDGKFFKSIELIKDVSQFHFSKIIDAFDDTNDEFKQYKNFTDWESVMTEYKERRRLNFNSIFALIPVRKDKEKKNVALNLFKSILENRKVEKSKLFKHFTELILCHYFERYRSYTNIIPSTKEYFGKTVRDSVFKYLAFFQFLRRLNLIDMEPEEQKFEPVESSGEQYAQIIQNFFQTMAYNQNQKAMFYLGRMLNTVAYIQKDKKKTVIEKVDFNGMNRDKIVRLRLGLFEKAKQYRKSFRIVFSDTLFAENFDFENWNMDPNEAVFFLLTGFSFGAKKKEGTPEDKTETS